MATEKEDRRPPYAPWSTIYALTQKFAATGSAPTMIDKHVTSTMDGVTRSQVRSAMKFLGLIDLGNRTLPRFDQLVAAFGTEKWKADLAALLTEKYAPIVDGLNMKQMTMGELKSAFKEHGGADGQVGEKAIRFFLSGLKEAGVEFSPFVSAPRASSSNGSRRSARKPRVSSSSGRGERDDERDDIEPVVSGVTRWPIPIPGKANATIIVPNDIDMDDWSMINAVVSAYIQLALKNTDRE